MRSFQAPDTRPAVGPDASLGGRDPVKVFAVVALALGWVLLSIPAIAGVPQEPFLIGLVLIGLLAPALVITKKADGPGAIRKLLSRILIWRFSPLRWGVILFGVPLLTVGLAAVSGTLETPKDGWSNEMTGYLIATLIFPMLLINLWEETAWGGFVQSRLMARKGLLVGSLMTAVLFAAIHLPLQFEEGWTWAEVAEGAAWLALLSPFARYLLGMHLLDTRGSILAIAVQHASWNATQSIAGIDGDWQMVAGTILLTLIVAGARRQRHQAAHPLGVEAEKATAAAWVAPPGTGAVPKSDVRAPSEEQVAASAPG